MPFAKDEDREYFDSRMGGLINELNRYGAGDLSSDSRADYLVGFLSQAADEAVANGVAGTLWKQQYDASALEARKENPESFSEDNYQFGLQNYNAWLNDKQVGTDVNDYSNPWTGRGVGRYQPFVNVDKMLREELEKIDPEITFEIVPFGNGIQYFKNKYELITDEKLLNSINLQVQGNPQLKQQLDINAWSTYSAATDQQLIPEIQSYYSNKAQEAAKSIDYFRKQKAGASTQQLEIINQEIDNLKKLQSNFEQQASTENITNLLSNPSSRVSTIKSLYNDGLFSSYAFQYAQQNITDMDVFADAAAKADYEASLARESEKTKAANDVMLKAYEAYGQGNSALGDSYIAYIDDVLKYGFDPQPTADGTGYTAKTARQKMMEHRMGLADETMTAEPLGTPDGKADAVGQFTSHLYLTQTELDNAITNLASTKSYGETRAETVATINSWGLEQLTEAINNEIDDPIVQGHLRTVKRAKLQQEMGSVVLNDAAELTTMTIQNDVKAGNTFWFGDGYSGDGEYLYISNHDPEVKDGLYLGNLITPSETRAAYNLIKQDEYERRTRPISQGGYGTVGGWFVNRAVDLYDYPMDIVSAGYDYTFGRARTAGRYVPSYKRFRVSRNMQELYLADTEPGKPTYTDVSGFLGYDIDGDRIPDAGATSGNPIYGEGLVAESQKPTGQRFREELGKGATLYLSMVPGANVGRTGNPAGGGVVGGVVGRYVEKTPFVGRYISRVIPRPGRRTVQIAQKNYRRGQFLPGGGRATTNIAQGQRIPGGTGRTFGRDLFGLTTAGGVGVGIDAANIAYNTQNRQQLVDEANRRASGFAFQDPTVTGQNPFGLGPNVQFFGRNLNENLIAAGVLENDDALREAISQELKLDFFNERNGSMFFDPQSLAGALEEDILGRILIDDYGVRATSTRRLSLNTPEAEPYLDEIFATVNPDGSRLFPDIPSLQSAATFTASQKGDPTKDEEAVLIDVVGIGSGNVGVEITIGDEKPIYKPLPIGRNTRFYKEVIEPENEAYANAIDNTYANVGMFRKSRRLIDQNTKILPDGTIQPGDPLTNKLETLTIYDSDSRLYIRPQYTMTYEAYSDEDLKYHNGTYDGEKVLKQTGVAILDENKNVLAVIKNAGVYNFDVTIGETRPNVNQDPNMPTLLEQMPDDDVSLLIARNFFNNTDMVQAVLDEFSKSN
jgi:hypothetical protein